MKTNQGHIFLGKTTWAIGDGIGGTEVRIGLVASKQDCYVICSKTMKNGQLANGATIDVATNKNCYCEFGMNKRNTNKKWTSTFIVRGLLIIYHFLDYHLHH